MRILFSLTYYTPYISGLTLYVRRIAESLSNRYECTVLCMQHDKELPMEESIRGIRVVRTKPDMKLSKGFFSIDWLFKSWHEVKAADVIFINLPQPEGLIPAFFGRLAGKKIISVYHCELVLPGAILSRFIEKIVDISAFCILLLSDSVVTYTKDYADHSRLLPFFRKKLHFIYPPVVKPVVKQNIRKLLNTKINKRDEVIIGIAARLAADKGIEYLLEAVPFLSPIFKKFKIVVAGPMNPVGEEAYKKKISALVEKYKGYVTFLGSVKPDDMGSFYSCIDVLVLSSINATEAFGMVQVEAMMSDVPVVASDLPGVRVPVQETKMGKIVSIKNSQQLADALIEVLQNRKKYHRNVKLIEKIFPIDRTIDELVKLIQ